MSQVKKGWFYRHDIVPGVVVFMLAAIYASQYLLWTLSVFVIIFFALYKAGSINLTTIYGLPEIIALIVIGLIMGAGNQFINNPPIWPYLRDLVRATVFPFFWCAVSMIVSSSKWATRNTFYRTIFLICALTSIIDFFMLLPARIAAISEGFRAFTAMYRGDELVIAFGFFLCMINPIGKGEIYIGRISDFIFKCFIIVNLAISFSRTAIVIMLIFVFPFFLKKKGLLTKTLIIFAIAVIIVWMILPDIAESFYDKIVNSIKELSTSHAWTPDDIVNNWRGFEIYCEQKHFMELDWLHKIFGDGFGSNIDVYGYEYLVTSEKNIPYLHNGYYNTLLKSGIVGVFINILYYLVCISKFRKMKMNVSDKTILIFNVVAMAAAEYVSGGALIGYIVPMYTLICVWLIQIYTKQNSGEVLTVWQEKQRV